jgi:hypothetical protein
VNPIQPTFDYGRYKTVGLIVFFVAFAIVELRLVLTRRSAYERAARLPLDDAPPPAEGPNGAGEPRR